jgi:Raf kinase inhibitor-like YbhB/YbcL family protein
MRHGLRRCSNFSISARHFHRVAVTAFLCLLAILFACRHEPEVAQVRASPTLQVESSTFANGEPIPARNTCDGANISPVLKWSVPPAGTKSVAIVMHDPDALVDFTHWIVFNIPPGVESLPVGASEQAGLPRGSSEGSNDFDQPRYGGPCPPGGKLHHYLFHVYALDLRLNLPPGASRKQLDSAISGHILADGEITGTYRRQNQ